MVSILCLSGCDLNQKTVTLSVTTEGSGSVTSYPGEGTIPVGAAVLLIPRADAGWIFDAWIKDGHILAEVGELAFTIEQDYSITARFLPEPPLIPMLGYRLEADWNSFAKADKMLNARAQVPTATGRGFLGSEKTFPRLGNVPLLSGDEGRIPREKAILIKFKQGFTLPPLTIIDDLDWAVSSSMDLYAAGLPYIRVVVDEQSYDSIPSILQQLRKTEGIEVAEEDLLCSIYSVSNDPMYCLQWNFEMLDMPTVWDVTTGDEGVIVAVLDTGVYFLLDDLSTTRFAQGYDFINNSIYPFDDNGHGSHVTGTIAQSTNNNFGVAGIAPDITILPVKVLAADGYGDNSQVAQGILFAVNNGADIINMSLGGEEASDLIADACQYASDHGVLVIAATGNEGASSICYPAALDTVMAVGAVNEVAERTDYSNYGVGMEIMAPGGDNSRTILVNGYENPAGILQETYMPEYGGEVFLFFDGTSMAAPHVAGLAALIKSKNHSLTGSHIREIICSTADDDATTEGYDTSYGYGLINPVRALGITSYEKSDSINSSIAVSAGTKHRWRISAAQGTIHANLSYLDDTNPLSLCLEKPDGTILKEGSVSGELLTLSYEVDTETAGYLYVTITVGDVDET